MAPVTRSVGLYRLRQIHGSDGTCLLQVMLQWLIRCREVGRGLFIPYFSEIHFDSCDVQMGFQILHKLLDKLLLLRIRERKIVSWIDNSTKPCHAFIRNSKAVLGYRDEVV